MNSRRSPLRLVATMVLGSVLLAGCASQSVPSADEGFSKYDGMAVGPDGVARSEFSQDGSSSEAPAAERSEIVTVNISLEADDPIATANAVADVATNLGGRVDHRSERPSVDDTERPSGDDAAAVASLTIRVPAADVDAALDDIGESAAVVEVNLSREDVTLQVQDLEARIAALQASVTRLHDLIAQATSTSDLIAAESALSQRQGELDSLTGQQRYLRDQVAMATISVSIATPGDAPRSGGFLSGLENGWKSLVNSGAALIIFTGAIIPWLVFFGLLGGLFYVIRRAIRSRRST
ncbi:MAG: DUF4349 domain-containing protein [Rhodococcus sp.]|nr:DUF4349 domain-containing protein [Rhodococcus sp. (in: high G+C Gram-positive bacteria)]